MEFITGFLTDNLQVTHDGFNIVYGAPMPAGAPGKQRGGVRKRPRDVEAAAAALRVELMQQDMQRELCRGCAAAEGGSTRPEEHSRSPAGAQGRAGGRRTGANGGHPCLDNCGPGAPGSLRLQGYPVMLEFHHSSTKVPLAIGRAWPWGGQRPERPARPRRAWPLGV